LVILDDGYQHRRLHRDLDLLVVDAATCLGNGKMVPFGPLREPLSELGRAHAMIITGTAEMIPACSERMSELIRKIGLERPIFACERQHAGFLREESEEVLSAPALKGLRILAFSGIAQPGAFESDLEQLGLNVVSTLRFRDHQPFGPTPLRRIREAARRHKAELLITTEKDRVRLGSARFRLPVVSSRIRLVPQDEEGLWHYIDRQVSGLDSKSSGVKA
jgi:tetraacyldisaccharide 4'-kinase